MVHKNSEIIFFSNIPRKKKTFRFSGVTRIFCVGSRGTNGDKQKKKKEGKSSKLNFQATTANEWIK